MIPEWLKKGNCACCEFEIKGKTNFIEKTLVGISSLLEEVIFNDNYPLRKGFLQSLDPRYKLITILALIIVVSLLNNPLLIIGVYALTLLLAYISRIEIWFFIKRVWLFIPLFAGVIVIPSIFSFITPGDALIKLSDGITILGWRSGEIIITRQGVSHAIIFVSRVATSVSLVVLLTLTTKWNDLIKSLNVLRIPKIFVLTFAMCYRYIFLLLRMIQDMHLAKKSRTIRLFSTKKEQKWVASRIGYLLIRSIALSNEIHLAMLSRGFTGELILLNFPKLFGPFKL